MHQTKPFLPRIILSEYEYDTVWSDILGREVRKSRTPTVIIEYDDIYDLLHYVTPGFVDYHCGYDLKTQFGDDVTLADVPPQLLVKYHQKRSFNWRVRHSGRRRTTGSSIRHPKTYGEHKSFYDPDIEEYNVKIRGSRRGNHLPDVYWEMWKPYGQKNWKHYRKTQYK